MNDCWGLLRLERFERILEAGKGEGLNNVVLIGTSYSLLVRFAP